MIVFFAIFSCFTNILLIVINLIYIKFYMLNTIRIISYKKYTILEDNLDMLVIPP